MRRQAPRPLSAALGEVLTGVAPGGLLARVQAAWAEAVGPAVAEEAQPLAERDGVVTVACRAAVWAQELELLGGDLTARLNGLLRGPESAAPVTRLRFVVRDP